VEYIVVDILFTSSKPVCLQVNSCMYIFLRAIDAYTDLRPGAKLETKSH
jgi:hypothetical protein